jgi:hypothetical protein
MALNLLILFLIFNKISNFLSRTEHAILNTIHITIYFQAISFFLNFLVDLHETSMPQLQPSEIFLISLVISLWLISIIICLRRYSLFLCFHKRDVPFYNINLIGDDGTNKDGAAGGSEKSRPLSPMSTSQRTCTYLNLNAPTGPGGGGGCNSSDEACQLSSNFFTTNTTSTPSNQHLHNLNNHNVLLSLDQKLNRSTASMNFYCHNCKSYSLRGESLKSVPNATLGGRWSYTNKPLTSWFNKTKLQANSSNLFNDMHSQRDSGSLFKSNKVYVSTNRVAAGKTTMTTNGGGGPLSSSRQLIQNKRALIRKKHFNLMSLDENALNSYREQHKYNQQSQQMRNQNPETIPEHQECERESGGGGGTKERPVNTVTTINSRKLCHLATSNHLPHANFISLRSGSDSVNSSWVKPAHSYDSTSNNGMANFIDYSNELYTSSSLQQSQFLQLPPSLINIQNFAASASANSSRTNIINNNANGGQHQHFQQHHYHQQTPPPASPVRSGTPPPLVTSQRPINPMSSLRRHMFVNSKRNAQTTTLDCPSGYYRGGGGGAGAADSFNNEQSYDFAGSLSFASSNNQIAAGAAAAGAYSPNLNKEPLPSILSNPTSRLDLMNTNPNNIDMAASSSGVKMETVNECDNNPNLLNPSWIPPIVRQTLLEMHERAVKSKSDSNIKAKYRSSNHLLHSVHKSSAAKSHKSTAAAVAASGRKKKPLSLQNSQDKSMFYSVTPHTSTPTRSYLNNFYDELKHRLFPIATSSNFATGVAVGSSGMSGSASSAANNGGAGGGAISYGATNNESLMLNQAEAAEGLGNGGGGVTSNVTPGKSDSMSNTMSTNVSTGFKQDSSSKQNSHHHSSSSSSLEMMNNPMTNSNENIIYFKANP